jgi:hypothetical protein
MRQVAAAGMIDFLLQGRAAHTDAFDVDKAAHPDPIGALVA